MSISMNGFLSERKLKEQIAAKSKEFSNLCTQSFEKMNYTLMSSSQFSTPSTKQ